MGQVKHQKNRNFTMIPNQLWVDPNLSGNSVRLYGLLKCKPDGWTFRSYHLQKEMNLGRDGFRTAVRQLIDAGWVQRTEARNQKGQSEGFDYFVRNNKLNAKKPETLERGTEKPGTEKPGTENTAPYKDVVEQETVYQERVDNNNDQSADNFEDFWAAYPRKLGKGQARKAFEAAIKKTTVQQIANGLEAYIQHIKESETDAAYIKHPSTWLNGECWEDEHEPVARGRADGKFGFDGYGARSGRGQVEDAVAAGIRLAASAKG